MPSKAPIAVDPSGASGAAATSSTVTDVLANGFAEVRRGNALTDSLTDSLQQPAESGAPSSPTPGPPSPPSDGLAIEMSTLGSSDAGHIADATNDDGPGLDVGLFDASVRDLGALNPEEVRALRRLVEVQLRPRPKRACSAQYCVDRGRRFSQLPKHPCCWLFGLMVSIIALARAFCGGGGMLDACQEGGLLMHAADCAPLILPDKVQSMYDVRDCADVGPGGSCVVRCANGWSPAQASADSTTYRCPEGHTEKIWGRPETSPIEPPEGLHGCTQREPQQQQSGELEPEPEPPGAPPPIIADGSIPIDFIIFIIEFITGI